MEAPIKPSQLNKPAQFDKHIEEEAGNKRDQFHHHRHRPFVLINTNSSPLNLICGPQSKKFDALFKNPFQRQSVVRNHQNRRSSCCLPAGGDPAATKFDRFPLSDGTIVKCSLIISGRIIQHLLAGPMTTTRRAGELKTPKSRPQVCHSWQLISGLRRRTT